MGLGKITQNSSQNSSNESDPDTSIVAEINITPLTDIFLVLLIIFMVTSSALSQMGVSVQLPAASQNSVSAQPEGVIVSLLPNGAMKVNQKEIPAGQFDRLRNELKSAFQGLPSRVVILEGDRQAFLGLAIRVMDEARKAGAQKFAIAALPSE